MMKSLLGIVAVALVAAGCNGGEPQGNIAPPDVKVLKPGDPGQRPEDAQGTAAPEKAGGGAAVTD